MDIKISNRLDKKFVEELAAEGIPSTPVNSPFTDIETDRYLILIRDADDIALVERVKHKADGNKKHMILVFIATDPMKKRVKWLGKALKSFPNMPVAILPESIISDFVRGLVLTESTSVAIPKAEEEMMVSTLIDRLGINTMQAKLLKNYFNSFADIIVQTEESLVKLKGIGNATARAVLSGVQKWKKAN